MKPVLSYTTFLNNKAEQFTVGPEYLSIKYDRPLNAVNERKKKLDSDNSNVCYLDINDRSYSITLNIHGGVEYYIISTSYEYFGTHIPVTIARIAHHTLDNKRERMNMPLHTIVIYGLAFRLIETGIYEGLIDILNDIMMMDIYDILIYGAITRLELKVDYFFHKNIRMYPKLEKYINIRKSSKTSYYSVLEKSKQSDVQNAQQALDGFNSNNELEYTISQEYKVNDQFSGWSVGSKKCKKSNYIRCYNKNIDILMKGKGAMYSDYFQYNVWRIEIEFKTNFCVAPNGEYYTLNALDELIEKGKQYMGFSKNTQSNYYYDKNTIPELYINRALSVYKTSTKKIAGNGFNPLELGIEGLKEGGFTDESILGFMETITKQYTTTNM